MGFLSALLGVSKVETPPPKEQTAEAVTPEEALLRLRELPTTRFDLHDVYYLNREYGPLMLVDEKNASIVNHDIGEVNDLLAQIKKKRRYKIEPIPMPEYGPHGSYMTVAPLTKTGKVAKYPFSINFGDRSNMLSEKCLFGDLFYLEDGTLGKAKYICWYESGKGYEIDFGLVGTTFSVLRVKKLGGVKPVTLYDRKNGEKL